MKRVFTILVLLVVCVLAYGWWKNHTHDQALNDGEVSCDGCMSPERTALFLKENAGEDADGQKEHKSTQHNISADEKGGVPATSTTTTVATSTMPAASTVTTPIATTTTTTTTPAVSPITPMAPYAPAAKETTVSTTRTPSGAPPAYDTVAPNPPNGAVFTGSGAYQWYRQGNLTWRVDSKTGHSCIVFATDEEWRKERVMSHGCGKNA